MAVEKINCWVCNSEFEGDVHICCTSASADCGCLGLPVNGPLVCSEKCYNEYMEKIEKREIGNNPFGSTPLDFTT